ncbi:hypothetical protein Salat_2999400, partial [Sesamum alatum]
SLQALPEPSVPWGTRYKRLRKRTCLMRGLRKLSNFEAITPKRVKPQKQVTLTSRQMVKSTGQAHTQEGRNERLIDLLLDRRYKGSAGNRTLSRKGFRRRVSVSYESSG